MKGHRTERILEYLEQCIDAKDLKGDKSGR